MKTLTEYNSYLEEQEFNEIINEGLLGKLGTFLGNIFKKLSKLSKSKKVTINKIEPDNLKKFKKELKFDDIVDNKELKELAKNKNFGFPILSKVLNGGKQYIEVDEIKYNPKFYQFFYNENNINNLVGIVGVDESVELVKGHLTLYLIECSINVEDERTLYKSMINDIINEYKDSKYENFAISPVDPGIARILGVIGGFSRLSTNKKIYTRKMK